MTGWRIVFWIAASVSIVGFTFSMYCLIRAILHGRAAIRHLDKASAALSSIGAGGQEGEN